MTQEDNPFKSKLYWGLMGLAVVSYIATTPGIIGSCEMFYHRHLKQKPAIARESPKNDVSTNIGDIGSGKGIELILRESGEECKAPKNDPRQDEEQTTY